MKEYIFKWKDFFGREREINFPSTDTEAAIKTIKEIAPVLFHKETGKPLKDIKMFVQVFDPFDLNK